MDYTKLFCSQCGHTQIIPLTKPLDLELDGGHEPSPQIHEQYHKFSSLLEVIDELKYQLRYAQNQNESMKDTILSYIQRDKRLRRQETQTHGDEDV